MAVWTLLGGAMSSTVEYTKEYTAVPAAAFVEQKIEVETLEDQIVRIAEAHKIATTTLYNLVGCESSFDPLADNGSDRGLLQISRKYHPEVSDKGAFDPEWALNWGAEKIAREGTVEWVCGNCYLFAKSQVPGLPLTKDLIPNSDYPRVGGVIQMDYNGTPHYPVVLAVKSDGVEIDETNYEPGKRTKRFLTWGYLRIHNARYWHPVD